MRRAPDVIAMPPNFYAEKHYNTNAPFSKVKTPLCTGIRASGKIYLYYASTVSLNISAPTLLNLPTNLSSKSEHNSP